VSIFCWRFCRARTYLTIESEESFANPKRKGTMTNFIGKLVLLVLIVFGTAACAAKIAYKNNFPDPTSPEDKALVFSLRDSTILISSSGSDKKTGDGNKTTDQTDNTAVGNSCPEPFPVKTLTPF